jgi:hypothetical protein
LIHINNAFSGVSTKITPGQHVSKLIFTRHLSLIAKNPKIQFKFTGDLQKIQIFPDILIRYANNHYKRTLEWRLIIITSK